METSDLMLDGNALAGPLAEIFVGEMTMARATCAACGAVREVGSLRVFMAGPGTVARCPDCEAVLLRVVRAERRIWLEARGIASLELARDD
jgi:hypothetical protein